MDHVKLVTFPYRYAGNAGVFDAFNLPAKLFCQGQAYALDCRIEPTSGAANLAISFQPVAAALGKVRLGGEFIRRVVLDQGGLADGFTAVLDAPTPEVEVPVGLYARQMMWLQRPAYTNVVIRLATNRLSVAGDRPATLNVGGPLTNSVELGALSGGDLKLQYRLVNAAGTAFHLAFQDEKRPPRFEIRQRETLLDRGQFEFG